MKKQITLILLALLSILVYTGCGVIQDTNGDESQTICSTSEDALPTLPDTTDDDSQNEKGEEYVCIIADVANDEYSPAVEADYWSGTYFIKENMSNKNCSIQGEIYEGQYIRSIVNRMNSYTTDIYRDEKNIEFGLRADTGELAHINFMNSEFFDAVPELPDVENPYDFAISLATEVAQEFIDDIVNYERIVEDKTTSDIPFYFVTFARKIDGYYTSDYITVKVTTKGSIASIMTGDIGAFDTYTSNINANKVAQSVSQKLESAYKNKKITVKSTTIDDEKLVRTPNGEFCVYSEIIVNGYDESNAEIQTGVRVLTMLLK